MNGADQQQPAAFATRASSSPDFTVAATTAADLLAIERSLNEGLRAEVDLLIKENTKAAKLLAIATAMLTPEQAANLITKLQGEQA